MSQSTCHTARPCLPDFTLEHVLARRVVTAVVAPFRFLVALASCHSLPLALFLYLSALGSSRLSAGVLATTASADSPLALTRGVSPGKVRELSQRAAGLYPPRFFDSLWALRLLARSPPVAGLSVRSCSCGRRFAFGFFQLPLTGSTLPFGYGCRCRLRQTPFILIVRAHAGHTSAALLAQLFFRPDYQPLILPYCLKLLMATKQNYMLLFLTPFIISVKQQVF